MNAPARRKSSHCRHHRGFALVLTVTLLSLLLLTMIALATVTKVETSIGINSLQQNSAEQNALYALDRALGELQRHAGPDQRITATASIRGDGTPNVAADDYDNNAHWTGVWDVDGTGLRSWLVSGNEDIPDGGTLASIPNTSIPGLAAGLSPTTDISLGGTPARLLVGRNTVGSAAGEASRYVVAPLQQLESPESGELIGRYAWWIGDEGVKATITDTEWHDKVDFDDLQDAYASSSPSGVAAVQNRARLAQLALPRHRITAVYSSVIATDPTTEAQLRRVLTPAQFAFVNGAPSTNTLRSHFHDFTVSSLGVLSDPVLGGLKRDLTNPGSGTDARLLQFLALRPNPSTTTNTLAQYDTARYGSGSDAWWIAPIVSEARFIYHFSSSQTQSNGTVQVSWSWDVELWNPYNVELSFRTTRLILENPGVLSISDGTVTYVVSPFRIFGLASPNTITIFPAASSGNDPNEFTLPVSSLDPGEVRRVGKSGIFTVEVHQNDPSVPGSNKEIVFPNTPPSKPYTLSFAPSASGSPRFTVVDVATGNVQQQFVPPAAATTGPVNAPRVYALQFRLRDDPDWLRMYDPRSPVLTHYGSTNMSTAPFDDAASARSGLLATMPIPPAGVLTNNARVAVWDLPRQQQLSIGALQHFYLPLSPANTNPPAYRIGNPWAGTINHLFSSSGFMNANSLFDQAFFSTLPRTDSADWSVGTEPLPNTRMKIYTRNASSLPTLDELVALGADANDRKPASQLLVRGAFNVNSTSSDAWRLLLRGTRIENWRYSDDESGGSHTVTLNRTHFRHSHTAQTIGRSYSAAPSSSTHGWRQGVRELTDSQVSNVATYLVDHVRDAFPGIKASGEPFRSVADFANSGILQSAIDSDASINNGLDPDSPAFLTQADLLTSWAPFLQARSDTFVIRAYGESINPVTGEIEARAWCEAVAQRTPDYVDLGENPEAWEMSLGPTNSEFGRRFSIVSFRWLTPADI